MADNYVLNKTADESGDFKDESEIDPLDLADLNGVSGKFKYKNSDLR